jgi:iron-sulfur cluster assembly protein
MSDLQTPSRAKRALPPLMTLTDAAAARLKHLYSSGQEGKKLRVALSTKGCSGLSYDMSWVDEPGPGDEVVNDKGVTVLVDRKATLFLIGTTMDFQQQALSSAFSFINPNEKGRCGCGESFHV